MQFRRDIFRFAWAWMAGIFMLVGTFSGCTLCTQRRATGSLSSETRELFLLVSVDFFNPPEE